MEVFIFLIPITIFIATIILMVLVWSINDNQCDDLQQKGANILFVEEKSTKENKYK